MKTRKSDKERKYIEERERDGLIIEENTRKEIERKTDKETALTKRTGKKQKEKEGNRQRKRVKGRSE